MKFAFTSTLVDLIRALRRDSQVPLFWEHRAFYTSNGANDTAEICERLGYQVLKRADGPKGAAFLKKVGPHGIDTDHLELFGDQDVPEHEAFAVREPEFFDNVVVRLGSGGYSGVVRIPKFDQNGPELKVAIFALNSLGHLQIIWRKTPLFAPEQVFNARNGG